MDSDIDKKMRPIIEKFNISKHVKTVFCCAGHKCRREDGYPNWAIVYIVFEMDKEQVGTFLDLAFTSLTKKMFVHNLCLRLSRSFYCQKALKNRERVVLQFYNDESQLSMKQIRLARNYFMNLAEKAVAAL